MTSIFHHKTPAVHCLLLLFFLAVNLYSQNFSSGYYRLNSLWQGEGKSLDVINDGTNNKLQLAQTTNASGQFWKITSAGNGYYRLTTMWLGEGKSLEAVENNLYLTKTDNNPGQFWKITAAEGGYYRLTSKLFGESKSLDIVNDGANNKLRLADTGNFSGQKWKITFISSPTASIGLAKEPDQRFSKIIFFSGFKIILDPDQSEKVETKEALNILSGKLEEITKIIDQKHLDKLKKVPIWIQYKLMEDGAMWYHPNKEWLLSSGYPAEMAKSIEIKNLRHFVDWQGDQPLMVLHELAHAHQDMDIPELQAEITAAYDSAKSSGKYESVAYVRGGKQRHYALTNKLEYFAELSEAYFGANDFYPFNRQQLREFDPVGYKIMQAAWE